MVFAEMTPIHKKELIEELKRVYPSQTIAMVGDGTND